MTVAPTTSGKLESILRRELVAGERLLWSGCPAPRKLRGGFMIWLFAIPWTAFAVFWEANMLIPWLARMDRPSAVSSGFEIVEILFLLPFVAVGLGMLAMPILAQHQAKKTIYGLTDQRLLRVTAGRRRGSASLLLAQMGPIDVSADPDGYGTLSIQTGVTSDRRGNPVTETFDVAGVPDVARLESLLLEHAFQRER